MTAAPWDKALDNETLKMPQTWKASTKFISVLLSRSLCLHNLLDFVVLINKPSSSLCARSDAVARRTFQCCVWRFRFGSAAFSRHRRVFTCKFCASSLNWAFSFNFFSFANESVSFHRAGAIISLSPALDTSRVLLGYYLWMSVLKWWDRPLYLTCNHN